MTPLAAKGEPLFAELTPPRLPPPPTTLCSGNYNSLARPAGRRRRQEGGGEGIPEPAGHSPSARWLQRRAAKVRGAAGAAAANQGSWSILAAGEKAQGAFGSHQQPPGRTASEGLRAGRAPQIQSLELRPCTPGGCPSVRARGAGAPPQALGAVRRLVVLNLAPRPSGLLTRLLTY